MAATEEAAAQPVQTGAAQEDIVPMEEEAEGDTAAVEEEEAA